MKMPEVIELLTRSMLLDADMVGKAADRSKPESIMTVAVEKASDVAALSAEAAAKVGAEDLESQIFAVLQWAMKENCFNTNQYYKRLMAVAAVDPRLTETMNTEIAAALARSLVPAPVVPEEPLTP